MFVLFSIQTTVNLPLPHPANDVLGHLIDLSLKQPLTNKEIELEKLNLYTKKSQYSFYFICRGALVKMCTRDLPSALFFPNMIF